MSDSKRINLTSLTNMVPGKLPQNWVKSTMFQQHKAAKKISEKNNWEKQNFFNLMTSTQVELRTTIIFIWISNSQAISSREYISLRR